jgi:peptide/nickel transport system ATP-binding protein
MLDVNNLKTCYITKNGTVKAVDDVSFHVDSGDMFGIAGESGCGKTTIALSIMGLLPTNATILGGQILFEGKDIIRMSDEELRSIRWKRLSIIFQNSMNALNPVLKVGRQVAEPILIHEKISKNEAILRTKELFELMALNNSLINSYPHELSGGMKQRVMMAMSLACAPSLVIADEPVTALDVMVQAQIMELLKKMRRELSLSMILITHDLSVIAETCNKVAIMYAGKLVEYADSETLFEKAVHPYTRKLIDLFPDIRGSKNNLESLPGSPPDLIDPPNGCRFHLRCEHANEECRNHEPKLIEINNKHYVACHQI